MENIIDWWNYRYRKNCVRHNGVDWYQQNAAEHYSSTGFQFLPEDNFVCPDDQCLPKKSSLLSSRTLPSLSTSLSSLKISQNDHQIVFNNSITVSNDNINYYQKMKMISLNLLSQSQLTKSKCTYTSSKYCPFFQCKNTGTSWKFTMKYFKLFLIIFLLFINVLSGLSTGNGIDQINSNAIRKIANLSAISVRNDHQKNSIDITNINDPNK